MRIVVLKSPKIQESGNIAWKCYNRRMVEQTPDLSSLFPDENRRGLVQKFVGDVSGRFGIEKVVSVDAGLDLEQDQRVIVITEGTLKELGDVSTSAELDEVWCAIQNACKTDEEQILLGYIPTYTETQFQQYRHDVDEYLGKEVHVLWQKPTEK